MAAEEIVWYELNIPGDDELRNFLSQRRNVVENALSTITTSSVDYINNFRNYVTLNNPTYCKDLFQEKLPYIMGTTIGKGKVGQVALLSKGNTNLIIKSMSAKQPKYLSLRIIDHPGSDNPWNTYWKIYGQDNKQKIITVGGDNFSNQTSIHLILNLILGDNPHYIHQYDAFYCNESGYNVIEYSNGGDLHGFLESNTIDEDLLFNVIAHVLTPLSILKHPIFNFNHSDLKAKNVFAHQTSKGYIFKIADYDKSSITWNGYRFYNWSHHYKGASNPVKIEKDSTGIRVYKLSSMINLQLQTMHNPYGIPMSYDIYTFIISLFGSVNVWTKYINGELPRFKALMHRLFRDELYYIVLGKIAINHTAVISLSNINKILNGLDLQYDVSFIYELVGLTPPILESSDSERLSITVSKDGHLCTDACTINPEIHPTARSCTTNTYSKTGIKGISAIYNWDYCQP